MKDPLTCLLQQKLIDVCQQFWSKYADVGAAAECLWTQLLKMNDLFFFFLQLMLFALPSRRAHRLSKSNTSVCSSAARFSVY